MDHVGSTLSRRQLLALAGAAARLTATEPVSPIDFWNNKPPEEWSTADIYRLANHSPWANPVQSWARNATARGGTQVGGSPWPPSPEWGPKGVITWESASPIRAALRTPLPYLFADHYVIGVDGIPLGNVRSASYLRQFAVLRCKSKAKWNVRALVAHELVRTSVVYAFGFSRADAPIDQDTEEVAFEAEFGRYMVQTKFRPKDMLYHGQLAV